MWRAAFLAVVSVALGALGAGCDSAGWVRSLEQGVTGQCLREPAAGSGIHVCAADAMCPCGAYCDAIDHVCRAVCAAPPSTEADSCGKGMPCNASGRCISPAGAHRGAL